jgi:hypothetical protein
VQNGYRCSNYGLQGCDAVWSCGWILIFRGNILVYYLRVEENWEDMRFICLSMALQLYVEPQQLFQFLDFLHSRQDSLDRGSACRKAATYTQDSTNTE